MLIYLFHPHISNCKQFHNAKIINLRESSVFKSAADGFSLTATPNLLRYERLAKQIGLSAMVFAELIKGKVLNYLALHSVLAVPK